MVVQTMVRAALLLLTLTASLTVLAADPKVETYAIDPAHSTVGFSVEHMTVSQVTGKFTSLKGAIVHDEGDVTKSSVEVAIKAESVDTGIDGRDKHLRTADFFDVEKFPEITFKSSKVTKKGKNLFCTGTFTMHGVSKEITIPFRLVGKVKDPSGNQRIGFAGDLTLNRQDYGITWGKTLENGGLTVGNLVKITLNVEAVKKKAEETK
ncbi:MAG: YceI family protein [Acidobacteria bacterium]|nr:YceI family protein [Acidobacteriota bacterium]